MESYRTVAQLRVLRTFSPIEPKEEVLMVIKQI